MMTSKEVVRRSIAFQTPDRLPRDFPGDFGSDFAGMGMAPSVDMRPPGGKGVDEWGAVWDNIGVCQLGEVKQFPVQQWQDLAKIKIPDVRDPARWTQLPAMRQQAGDRFILAYGTSIYERVHFIRGMENTWMDIYESPDELCQLIDILTDMNLYAIERFADAGADAFFICDDWGLQNRLMISPQDWRRIWKPRYARIYKAAHDRGMLNFLHSCGYIVDILDDLIEIGLDVVHMDQQENMGLELLGRRFAGRLTFFSPVDIQTAMHRGPDVIRAYARQMAQHLARPEGGFIPRWYSDPKAAGHSQEALDTMCREFLSIDREMYPR